MGFPTERLLSKLPRVSIQDDKGSLTYEWTRWFSFLLNSTPVTNTYSAVVTPTSVSANSTSEQTITVLGLIAGSIVHVVKPTHTSGIGIVNTRVSVNDTLAITYMNCTAGSLTPASETYLVYERRL